MKLTFLSLALLAATAFTAGAQDIVSTPAPPELTVPDKPDAGNSEPSVSVTTDKKPTPSPKAKASSTPSKSSSPKPAKPSPTASPASASVIPKKSAPEAMIREMEEKWEASVMQHDSSVPQAYLADDFRGVSSKGKVMSKSNLLSEVKKDTDTYKSTKTGKIDVRVFGGQFAVATGTSTEVGTSKDGQGFNRTFRWTDVWALRKDQWQCVASQAMLVK